MKISRRSLLQQASLYGSTSVLGASKLWAETTAPLRLITVFSPHGTIFRRWRPRALIGSYHETAFDIAYSGSVLSPLAPYQDKMLILDGIDYRVLYDHGFTGHEGGMTTCTTGARATSTGPVIADCQHGSIEQYIAKKVSPGAALPTLDLAVGRAGGQSVYDTFNYAPGGIALPSLNNPVQVFDRLLGIKDSNTSPVSVYKRQVMLEFLQKDIKRLRKIAPSQSQQQLDIHLDSLMGLLSSFENHDQISPTCSLPASPNPSSFQSAESLPLVCQQQIDLLVSALYCRITQVGSLRLTHAGAGTPMPHLGLNIDIHDRLAHSIPAREDLNSNVYTSAQEDMSKVQHWYAQQIAKLMDALASRPEGSGTMLDHTIILWVNELGNPALHANMNVPWIVLGGSSDKFRMGRWLQLSQDFEPDCTYFFAQDKCPGQAPSSRQTAHNHVLVSILRAFGIQDSYFGHPAYQGALTQMF